MRIGQWFSDVTTRSVVTEDYSRVLVNGEGKVREEAVVFHHFSFIEFASCDKLNDTFAG